MLNIKTALVLTPHSDDLEFGCGGTVAKLVEHGVKVYSMVFFKKHPNTTDEWRDANEILNVESIFLELPIRRFLEYRQDILEELVAIKKRLRPDLVIQPSLSDIHQDHHTVAQEGLRAFKDKNLWGFEVPWNNLNFDTQLFVSLEDNHVEMKIEAIKCFKTQAYRPYSNEDCIRSIMASRGVQVGVKNAEAFNVIRQIL